MKKSERYLKYTKTAIIGIIVSFIALFVVCMIEFMLGGTREYVVENGVKTLTSSISWLRLPSNLAGVAIFIFLFSGLYFYHKYASESEKEYRQDLDNLNLGFDFKCDNHEVSDTILDGNALIDNKHSTYGFRVYSDTVEILGDLSIYTINEYGDNLGKIFDGCCIKFKVEETYGVDAVVHILFDTVDFKNEDYISVTDTLYTKQDMYCDTERLENYFRSLLSVLGDTVKNGAVMFIRNGFVYLYVSCKSRINVLPSEIIRVLLKVLDVEF